MGFLKNLLNRKQIPPGEVHTPWSGPGKRREFDDAQSGTSKRPHRGLALRNRKSPDLSEENQSHWTGLPEGWAREFVYNNTELAVHSSNVAYAQYWLDSQELYVHFLSGHGGTYSEVTEQEAIDFTQAGSKGGFVIDVLIGRANLKGHACWTVNGGRSIKPYKPGYRPGHIPLIPGNMIQIQGEPINLIPEDRIVVEGSIKVADEDIHRDKLRRQGQLNGESPSLADLNEQRKRTREFQRRLLNG